MMPEHFSFRHEKRECAAASNARGDRDIAANRACQLARGAESETQTAYGSRCSAVDLPERLEDMLQVFGCDPYAGVPYDQRNTALGAFYGHRDLAFTRETNRVGH